MMKGTLWVVIISTLLVVIHSAPVENDLSDTDDLETSEESGELGLHTMEDVIAQASCGAYMPIKPEGWIYAVRRNCISEESCADVCGSKYLHVQDQRTVSKTWGCIGAVHVYKGRPATGDGKTPMLGLKTHFYGYENCNARGRCGPNYCCCKVSH